MRTKAVAGVAVVCSCMLGGGGAAFASEGTDPVPASTAPGDSVSVASQTAATPSTVAPARVGLARLTDDWPDWLTLSVTERGRVESVRPPATRGVDYDTYYLNRLRLTAGVKLSSWFQATVQTQDARVAGYNTSPAPKTMQNPFDLRLAYAEMGTKTATGVSAIVGRQELTLGEGRLVASPDWGNVGRTYDGARVAVWRPGVRIEAFGVAPVDCTLTTFSRAKYGERLFGGWVTFDRVRPLAYLDGYTLLKTNNTATGELGLKGDQRIYATGVRAGGPVVVRQVTWETETVVERGHSATDDVSAWATHDAITWTIGSMAMKPRVTAEYNFGSGDNNAKDGTKHTFDQFYASTHTKWGLGDQIGWRNMQHVGLKLKAAPTKKLEITTAISHLALATVKDAWYGSSGSKIVTNTRATSRDLGWEPDLYGTYVVTRDLTVGAGVAVLVAGDFVRQSTDASRLWTPYVMWTYKF